MVFETTEEEITEESTVISELNPKSQVSLAGSLVKSTCLRLTFAGVECSVGMSGYYSDALMCRTVNNVCCYYTFYDHMYIIRDKFGWSKQA